ncbi:MAG: hypothetical protein ACYS4W_07980 [Planctomycetota bacterium]|jgi:hypothetical protein
MITKGQTVRNTMISTLRYLVKSAIIFALSLLLWAAWPVSTPATAKEHHSNSTEVLGLDLSRGWLDEPVHSHFSPLGTPLIHPFRIEPAFANPDLLVDYSFFRKSDEDEHEIQTELEWPLTRRLALITEVPYVFVDPKKGSSVDGIGDIGFGSRILLGEYERLLLAFNLEIETPTGDSDKGLGRGETAIAPSFSMWLDLDNWRTAHVQLGTEHEVSSSENQLFFRAALVHSLTSGDYHGKEHDDHIHGLPPGLLGLILEIDGTVDIAAEDSGHVETEGIFGVHYSISEHADLRSGYVFPFSKSQQLNSGFTCGLIWHF